MGASSINIYRISGLKESLSAALVSPTIGSSRLNLASVCPSLRSLNDTLARMRLRREEPVEETTAFNSPIDTILLIIVS
jgi:hypothetical protein